MQHSGRDNVYWLEKGGVRFTLFPLMNGSCSKVRHKVRALNKVADDLRMRACLMLMQKNEIVEVDQLKGWDSKFPRHICI